MTWLAHARLSIDDTVSVVVAGPGAAAVRCASRINGVLTAVRGMVVHAVATGHGAAGLVSMLYELADDWDPPAEVRSEDGRMVWRMSARHRLREPETTIDRASDEQIVVLLRACRSTRDRLIVLLMARGGLRRGEVCGLRRSDVHLLVDSRRLGCEVAREDLHVVRREDNPSQAWAKSRRERVVPLDFLVVIRALSGDVYVDTATRLAGGQENDLVVSLDSARGNHQACTETNCDHFSYLGKEPVKDLLRNRVGPPDRPRKLDVRPAWWSDPRVR